MNNKLNFKNFIKENLDWLKDHIKPINNNDNIIDQLIQNYKSEIELSKKEILTPFSTSGWKIHLALKKELSDKEREIMRIEIGTIINNNSLQIKYKVLKGGDPHEKDITIYCRTRKIANMVANLLSKNNIIQNYTYLSNDIEIDDIEIAKNIYARFDIKFLEQYGCKGHGLLSQYSYIIGAILYDKNNKNLNSQKIKMCEITQNFLIKAFGELYQY